MMNQIPKSGGRKRNLEISVERLLDWVFWWLCFFLVVSTQVDCELVSMGIAAATNWRLVVGDKDRVVNYTKKNTLVSRRHRVAVPRLSETVVQIETIVWGSHHGRRFVVGAW